MFEQHIQGTTLLRLHLLVHTSPQLGAFTFFNEHGKYPGGCYTMVWPGPSEFFLKFYRGLVLWMGGRKMGTLYGIAFNDKSKPELVYHYPWGDRVRLYTHVFQNAQYTLHPSDDILSVFLS
jgi:hypothetical protein